MPRVITVKVRAHAKCRLVEEVGPDSYRVHTTVAPEDGKANDDVLRQLADHFGLAKSNLEITRGHTSSTKQIRLNI